MATFALVCGACGAGAPTKDSRSTSSTKARVRIVSDSLKSVACPAQNRCIAVGSFLPVDIDAAEGDPDGDGHAAHTLVDSFNGVRWSVLSSPDGGRGSAVLTSVSCPTRRFCVAVGYYQPLSRSLSAATVPPERPLVESFEGRHWRIVATPTAPPDTILLAVSCPTVRFCVAAGYTTTGAGTNIFAETYDGEAWRVVDVATPEGSSSGFNAIACPSVSLCVAVGNISAKQAPTIEHPLIEMFDGASWTPPHLPSPNGGPGILYSVTCVSIDRCVAVGESATVRSPSAALVLSFVGTSWSTDRAALAQRGEYSLATVACADAARCLVAGTTTATLAAPPELVLADIDGGTWQRLKLSGRSRYVAGITCPSVSRCFVVGSIAASAGERTLIVSLAENTWTEQPSPQP